MKNTIKIKLSTMEVKSLLAVFASFNIDWIEQRNARLMVKQLLGKLQVKLAACAVSEAKTHSITLNAGQAAAFDEAFRQTYIPYPTDSRYFLDYEEMIINKIIDLINQVL